MKDYIYRRIVQAEQRINDEIDFTLKYRKAYESDFNKISKRVREPLNMKTMPNKYKEQIWSILWFCWEREIDKITIFPMVWENKVYDEWDNLPEQAKEFVRGGGKLKRIKIFKHHFTNGMERPEQYEFV